MVRMRLVWLAIIAAVPVVAQVIRVETREVPVDVIVTGRKGVSASDLTAKGFSVWEDGKPQKINSVVAAASDPETSLKHFVLYFDFNTMRTADQMASEKFAEDFIDGMASPDRYMAVVKLSAAGPRVLQDFTSARAILKKAVEIPPDSFGQVNDITGSNPQPRQLSDSLTAIAATIAPAPGRKALLLFTGGYSSGYSSPVQMMIAACNRANIAVYVIAASNPVSGGELDLQNRHDTPYPPAPGSVALTAARTETDPTAEFGRLLAEGTGGESLGLTASLKDRLAAIAREQDEYYRVFYTPPPAKEGTCHALRVAMNSRGLESRSRGEYCTEKAVDLVAGKIAGQALEARSAGAGAGSLDATMQLPYFYTGTNRAVVHLSVEFVPNGMKFTKDQAGLHGQIDIVGSALRGDGGTAARFADTMNIDLADQQHADAFTGSPYHYEQQFTVAAGTYDFQMAVGAGPNAVGKIDMPLKVEPWSSTALGIGGIAFSTETRRVDPPGAAAAPILEGQGPLIAGGRLFVPAATNRFQRSQAIYFYTEVDDPALGDSSSLKMGYRVLDQKTGDVKMDTGLNGAAGYVHPGNPLVPFATRLSVGQLPAGAYRLEVRAANAAGQETVTRTVDFELN